MPSGSQKYMELTLGKKHVEPGVGPIRYCLWNAWFHEFFFYRNETQPSVPKPTLKDYLNIMKESKSTPKDVYAVMNSLPAADESKNEANNISQIPDKCPEKTENISEISNR